jgi:ABC-2 type transport system ATP-binding protein
MTPVLPTRLPDDVVLAVRTHGLTKWYGRETALRDLALQVPAGAVYLLVGPNGAGKSTTLKLLLGLVRADAGIAEVLGLDARSRGPAVRANVGYVPERPEWGYGWMRVGRLLEHHARYFATWDPAYARHLAATFDLRLDQRLGRLSKGQARRVHLTMALAHRPPLLLLDEPTDGLDPLVRDATLGVLAEHLAESPTTVLLSTHHVEEVDGLADHVGVLRGGELRAQMPLDALRRGLRRYRAEVPIGWAGVPGLNGAVLRRAGSPREVQWTVWGDESDIANGFAASGATVRDAAPLSLPEATLALLSSPG